MKGEGPGTIFGSLTLEERRRCFVFHQCTDATSVSHMQASMTPCVHMCLSLPPHIRETLSAMYLGGVWPDKAKNPLFLGPVLEMFAALAPDGSGVDIEGTIYWAVFAWRVDDLRGIYGAICAKTAPAYNGACIQCVLPGNRVHDLSTTVYIGAVSHMPLGDPLRTAFKEVYCHSELESIAEAGDEAAPRKMTKAKALRSAERQKRGDLTAEQKMMCSRSLSKDGLGHRQHRTVTNFQIGYKK